MCPIIAPVEFLREKTWCMRYELKGKALVRAIKLLPNVLHQAVWDKYILNHLCHIQC